MKHWVKASDSPDAGVLTFWPRSRSISEKTHMQSIHSRNTTSRTQYTPTHRTNILAFLTLPIVRPRKTERESLRNLGRKSGQTIFSNYITSTMVGGTSFGTVQNSLPKQGLTSRSVSLAAFEICLAQLRFFRMQDLKHRYYSVCRKLIRNRPWPGDEASRNALINSLQFDIGNSFMPKPCQYFSNEYL